MKPPESAFEMVMMSGATRSARDSPESPGAAEPGLDLVDERSRVPWRPAQLGSRPPVLLGSGVDALSLDRLGDEGGHVAPAQLAPRGPIAPKGTTSSSRQQRAEPYPEFLPAVERKEPRAEAVERVVAVEDPGAAGGCIGRT